MVSLIMALTLAYNMLKNLYYGSGLASSRSLAVNTAKGSHLVYVYVEQVKSLI